MWFVRIAHPFRASVAERGFAVLHPSVRPFMAPAMPRCHEEYLRG